MQTKLPSKTVEHLHINVRFYIGKTLHLVAKMDIICSRDREVNLGNDHKSNSFGAWNMFSQQYVIKREEPA